MIGRAIVVQVLMVSVAVAQPEPERPAIESLTYVGGGLLLAGYVPAIAYAASTDEDDNELYIPVIGPWLELFDLPSCDGDELFCERGRTRGALLAADALAQGAGLVLMVASLRSDRDDGAPMLVALPGGVAVTGRF